MMNCQLPNADCDSTVLDREAQTRRELAEVQMKCDAAPSSHIRTSASSVEPHSAFGIRQSAFTLVEVMISIAIALVLILGISQIFSLAQQATGAGMAVLSATEQTRGAQQRFLEDFRYMDNGTDSPGLVITSYSDAAVRNRADYIGNTAGTATPMQMNNLVTGTGSVTAGTAITTNSRIHRVDRAVFWARNLFYRQTSDPPNLTSTTSSDEAMIWLGHVDLPYNTTIANWTDTAVDSGNYYPPGVTPVTTNQNNFFASDWILGREVMLLIPTPPDINYYPGVPTTPVPTSATVSPLSLLAPAKSVTGTAVKLNASRYDLAATSISALRQFLATRGTTASAGGYWWEELSGVKMTAAGSPTIKTDVRYWANPFLKKPGSTGDANWMSAAAAQTYPVFARGCTQFIVEFAGNFLTQDDNPTDTAYGNVLAGKPDPTGKIDFVIDPATKARHIRWYGFPRDLNGDGVIDAVHDVAPVATSNGGTPLLFERAVPANYTLTASGTTPPTSQAYQCAWGPDTDAYGIPRPRMIRITMALDDPGGHLNTEQVYQYVYDLP